MTFLKKKNYSSDNVKNYPVKVYNKKCSVSLLTSPPGNACAKGPELSPTEYLR